MKKSKISIKNNLAFSGKNQNSKILKILSAFLGEKRVKKDIDLCNFTTLKIHSLAEYFFEAKNREDLLKAKQISLQLGLPLFILGGGSNLAIIKRKIHGLVVRNLYQKKEIINEKKDYVDLLVSSGYLVSKLVLETIDQGFEGLEYHLALPGTVGGAIFMNSKWTKPLFYFGDYLIFSYLIDENGKIKKVDRDYFQFAYDFSILQKTKEILLEAIFRLKKTDPAILKKRGEEALNYRKQTQPRGVFSSGCFFKNINGKSAGYLIEQCGLKGYTVGDFYVSEKHANFIINRGNGKREDLMRLIRLIKEKVKEKFGLELEEEVVII